MSKKGNSCFIKNINLGADFEADAAVQTLEEVKGGKNLTRLDIDSDEFDQIICQIVKLHLVSEFEKLNSKRDILKAHSKTSGSILSKRIGSSLPILASLKLLENIFRKNKLAMERTREWHLNSCN
jgi:hypothetical protein